LYNYAPISIIGYLMFIDMNLNYYQEPHSVLINWVYSYEYEDKWMHTKNLSHSDNCSIMEWNISRSHALDDLSCKPLAEVLVDQAMGRKNCFNMRYIIVILISKWPDKILCHEHRYQDMYNRRTIKLHCNYNWGSKKYLN
jgi:hypothetical protein